MLAFLGTAPGSWALCNNHTSVTKNLPAPIQQAWDDLSSTYGDANKAGAMIACIASAPDGTYAIVTKDGQLLSNRKDLLAAAAASGVDHVALSPLGGWFLRFCDGSVQLSASPANGFSPTFCSLVGPHLDVRSAERQRSSPVRAVWFGACEAVALRAGDAVLSANLAPAVSEALAELTGPRGAGARTAAEGGYVLGPGSALCLWHPEYFFLEARSSCGPPRQEYRLPSGDMPREMVAGMLSEAPRVSPYSLPASSGRTSPASPRQQQERQRQQQNTAPPPLARPRTYSFSHPAPPAFLQPPKSHHRHSHSFSSSSAQAPHWTPANRITPPSSPPQHHQDQQRQQQQQQQQEHHQPQTPSHSGQSTPVYDQDHIPARRKDTTTCGGCWRDLAAGQLAWYCGSCRGAKDLCGRCWGDARRHCRHAEQGRVAMMQLGKNDSDIEERWSVNILVEGLGHIADAIM